MRVMLIHNPSSGRKRVTGKKLRRAFEDAGHEVRYWSTKKDDWKEALEVEADAVVAAGGDGTIRRVALALASNGRQHAPMGVVPLGTANNLARTIGIDGPESRIATGLGDARTERIAIGLVRGPGTNRSGFLEAAGLGVFSWMLRKAGNQEVETPEEGIALLQRLVEKAEPKSMRIEADGQDFSGDYLMVEVMNVSTIGPRLAVAPEADHTDDRLDLILIGEAEREGLVEYLDSMLHGLPVAFPVASRRVQSVRLDWQAKLGHVDDRPWPSDDDKDAEMDGEVTIRVDRHLELLVP